MKSIFAGVAAAGLMFTGNALAADMPELAKKMNCTACHAMDKKRLGPSFQEVANKYKGDANAAGKLQTKISKGGSGSWGTMPMPANDAAGTKQAEIKELVAFILGLAK